MNRIAHLWMDGEVPEPTGAFSDSEAFELLISYRADPSSVPCPTCGQGTIEVVAFIEPEVDKDGFASMTTPEGDYAAALHCHTCHRAIGILATALNESDNEQHHRTN